MSGQTPGSPRSGMQRDPEALRLLIARAVAARNARSRAGEDITQSEEARSLAAHICPHNQARSIVLGCFVDFAREHLPRSTPLKVAIVGGYDDDPELIALRRLGYDVSVELLGPAPSMTFLDLNEPIRNGATFDLVLCSQVWEHIWNHGAAFDTLIDMTRAGGFLWLACPTSNRAHGEPSYYSSGFTDRYLEQNLRQREMEIVSACRLGSPRCYRAVHTLPIWLSTRGHAWPLLFAFEDRPARERIALTVRFFFTLLGVTMQSPTFKRDSKFSTESLVVARKPHPLGTLGPLASKTEVRTAELGRGPR